MLSLYFSDFYPGFNPDKNFFLDCFHYLFGDISIVNNPDSSDLNIVSIFGDSHRSIINNYPNKTLLWLGENIRPNIYNPKYSLSCDLYDYGSTNIRLPLWYLEIDWFDRGTGLFSKQAIYDNCVLPGNAVPSDFINKDFCIAIFNNPEGLRMSMLNSLNSIAPVTCYGKPFGNWFPTFDSYSAKIEKMSNFVFNLCPENSYFPGYYTEKVIHSKMSGSIPLYMADPLVSIDFRPASFINIYDFSTSLSFEKFIRTLYKDKASLSLLANQPLFSQMPSISSFLNSIYTLTIQVLSTGLC